LLSLLCRSAAFIIGNLFCFMNSHDKLLALAEERSSYLTRGDDGSDSESQRRRAPVTSSLDRARQSGDQSLSRTAELRASLESQQSATTSSTVASHPSTVASLSSRIPQRQSGVGGGSSIQRVASSESTASALAQLRASQDRQAKQPSGLAAIASPGRRDRPASVASSVDAGEDKAPLPSNELEEMDKRIQALQMYLDKARSAL
jgi:hypothetical protein